MPDIGARAAPLAGLLVADFSHFVAGPYCSMMLGDYGATVIKIESPGKGDEYRYSGIREERLGGEGSSFLWSNRNKRGIVLDLKNPEALMIAREIITRADVLLENFSAGVMAKFGLDYEACSKLNPRLVYCSVSAYHRGGAFGDRRGFDTVAQAESGFIRMNGYADEEGVATDSTVMDIATAMMAANTVLAALEAREQTGRGQRVGVSLYDTALTFTGPQALRSLFGAATPRAGNRDPLAPPDGSYRAADRSFMLACGTDDAAFARLCSIVPGCAAFSADPRFIDRGARVANASVLFELFESVFLSRPWAHWRAILRSAGIEAGEIRSLPEAYLSEETADSGMLTHIPHPTAGTVPNLELGVRLFGTPAVPPVAAPTHGEHTREVLEYVLGYPPEKIDALARAGCFASKPLPGIAMKARAA